MSDSTARAALVDSRTAEERLHAAEQLLASWEVRGPYLPGSFHPEAAAYADGCDSARQTCAEQLRDVLFPGG